MKQTLYFSTLLLLILLFSGCSNHNTVSSEGTYESCVQSCKQKYLNKHGYQKIKSRKSCVKRCDNCTDEK